MYYKTDWPKAKKRLEAFWQGEMTDRACAGILAPRKNSKLRKFPHLTHGPWLGGLEKIDEGDKEGIRRWWNEKYFYRCPRDYVKTEERRLSLKPVHAEASSSISDAFSPLLAFDGNFGTLWATGTNNLPAWLKADFGKKVTIHSCEPFFDRVMGDYVYKIEYSGDNETWEPYAEGNNALSEEWPVQHVRKIRARYIRITIFSQTQEPHRAGLWELKIY